jgi:hypothetical protein
MSRACALCRRIARALGTLLVPQPPKSSPSAAHATRNAADRLARANAAPAHDVEISFD